MRGTSDSSVLKEQIQSLLLQIAIKRDGGCVLRDSPLAGNCGGYTKDGTLILQAEHLITRSNSASFADTRNIVCLCKRHHLFWKPTHSKLYWELIEGIVGPTRWDWLKKVEKDVHAHKTYKVDWKLEIIALKDELKKL